MLKVHPNNFSQSYENSFIKRFNGKLSAFYILKDENAEVILSALTIIDKDDISIPFGPTIYKLVSEDMLLNFLFKIRSEYNMPLQFSIEDVYTSQYSIISKMTQTWSYTTLLIELGMQM